MTQGYAQPLSGVPPEFLADMRRLSGLLRPEEHAGGCPVRREGVLGTCRKSTLCLPKDAPAVTRVVNLKRTAGWDVYVGRAGHGMDGTFGNPIRVGARCLVCGETHELPGLTIPCYTRWLHDRLERDSVFRDQVLALSGKILSCFCWPLPCHGSVLAGWLMEQAGWRRVR